MKHLQLTEDLQERAHLYAAGALDEKERREYARHLEEDDCDTCRKEVLESEAAAQSLAMNLPLQTPSESVKQRLMAQAESAAPERRERPGLFGTAVVWAGWLTSAATIVLLVLFVNLNTTLRSQVNALNARVVELQSQLGSQQTLLASLTASDRVFDLAGQDPTTQARGRIFWDTATGQWRFFVSDLPPAAAGRSYQLWFVPQAGDPISALVFDTRPDGSAELQIALPQGATALKVAAVTNEPEGGSPQPTAAGFVLLGSSE